MVDREPCPASVGLVDQRALEDLRGQLGVVAGVRLLHSLPQRVIPRSALVQQVVAAEVDLARMVGHMCCWVSGGYDLGDDGFQDDHSYHRLAEERMALLASRPGQHQRDHHSEKRM